MTLHVLLLLLSQAPDAPLLAHADTIVVQPAGPATFTNVPNTDPPAEGVPLGMTKLDDSASTFVDPKPLKAGEALPYDAITLTPPEFVALMKRTKTAENQALAYEQGGSIGPGWVWWTVGVVLALAGGVALGVVVANPSRTAPAQ